jgi:hypothetical protein
MRLGLIKQVRSQSCWIVKVQQVNVERPCFYCESVWLSKEEAANREAELQAQAKSLGCEPRYIEIEKTWLGGQN